LSSIPELQGNPQKSISSNPQKMERGREREKTRERKRERDKNRERKREREKDREREKKREKKKRERERDRRRERERKRERERERERDQEFQKPKSCLLRVSNGCAFDEVSSAPPQRKVYFYFLTFGLSIFL
jgi:ATPase subunit of ABC transporter with duplicated ATPase domains